MGRKKSQEYFISFRAWNGGRRSTCLSTVIILYHFFLLYPVSQLDRFPRNLVYPPIKISRQAYFKNPSKSVVRIQNDPNEWSLSDYKRRVSPTATVEASYEAVCSEISESSFTRRRRSRRASVSPGVSSHNSVDFTHVNRLSSPDQDGHILGLAAGGQMYSARDFRLLIVSLIS